MRRLYAFATALLGLCVLLVACGNGLPTQAQIDELLASRDLSGYIYVSHQPVNGAAILGDELNDFYAGEDDWLELEVVYHDGVVYHTSLEFHYGHASMRFALHCLEKAEFDYFTINRYMYSGPLDDPDRYVTSGANSLYSYVIIGGVLHPQGVVSENEIARHTDLYFALLSEAKRIANGGEAQLRRTGME